jgi:hypothetical protein
MIDGLVPNAERRTGNLTPKAITSYHDSRPSETALGRATLATRDPDRARREGEC